MPRVVQSSEYFVVGGPVQPDRACYVERAADLALRQGLLERRFCYVLGPKASGKTSLMARTIRGLRSEGQLAAVCDLTQIGARGENAEPGRWYYSIAYRIVRELRIKVDLHTWWQEKSVLSSEQRLADFFWEIVLANTTAAITVFFDEIERALELPFSRELFVALGTCYNGRATEPDYQRLNFVVMGVASPRQLGRGLALPLFEDGLAIEPSDFTLEESLQLAEGFESGAEPARAALERIYYWVKGQPYLTQKIARAVARRHGSFEDVDEIVRGQFLASGSRDDEPLLNHIVSELTNGGPRRRRALVLLGRLAKGEPIVAESGSYAQEILSLVGLTATADDEFVTFRNRLVKAVFTARWVRSALPFDWRGTAMLAAAALLLVLVPLWYTQYFPRPYIDTLTSVTDNYDVAMDTHDKLRRFPGFGATADGLLADIMVRRSEQAESFEEVRAADDVLRTLAGYAPTADRLLGAHWLRRSRAALREARRDEALVYAGLAQVGHDPAAASLAATLIDTDYASLSQSYRFASPLVEWEADWTAQALTALDLTQGARRLGLSGTQSIRYARALTALQHVPVSRELGVDEPGSAGAFLFQIDIEHPAYEQIVVTVEAPSGASVSFPLPPAAGSAREIRVTERSELAPLADEDRQGVWRLTLVDREEGAVGHLNRWGLLFAEELRGWEDVPDRGLEIPDPVRTDEIEVQVSADGRLGVARPSRPGAVGALTLWDLTTGTPRGDLPIDAMPTYSKLSSDSTRLVTVFASTLTIFDIDSLRAVSRIETQTGFALPPAVGVDGEYIAIAERLDSGGTLYSLLRAEDGELVASIEGSAGVTSWLLGPQARYLLLVGPMRSVRLIDPRRGDTLAELPHESPPVFVDAPTDDLLLSINARGDIHAWRFADLQRGDLAGRFVGVTADPGSVSVAGNGALIAYEAAYSHVVVRDLDNDSVRFSARVERADGPVRTHLGPDGSELLTGSGELLQAWKIGGPGPSLIANGGVSSMALDPTGQIVALGYRDGYLRIRTAAQLQEGVVAQEEIDYIGHQGAVIALAVNSERGLIASGGRDDVVRIWDLATGAPRAPYMRHSGGMLRAVAISEDGRFVASAGEDSARVWTTEDGELVRDVPVNGAALAVAIAPGGDRVATGDAAGNVFVADLAGAAPPQSGRAQAAVTALAFSGDGRRLASGDRSGRIQLWNAAGVAAQGNALLLPQAVRWLGFGAGGRFLVAQTDHWVHRIALAPGGLTLEASRMIGMDREAGAQSIGGGNAIRLVGGLDLGSAEVEDVFWDEPPETEPSLEPALLGRDWARALSLEVDDSAEISELTY
jgi:WD40 repeat protein